MSGSNFSTAFWFLRGEQRAALDAVYAYCRLVDDIVDGDVPVPDQRAALQEWRHELELAFSGGVPRQGVARGLQEAHRRFGVRHEDALAVLEGCEIDLVQTRYATWDELRRYCYHVASAVGLMCVRIFDPGRPGDVTREYAINLGLALQVINIIRDVAEDARRGRIYLPQEDLLAFGVREEDVLAGRRGPEMLRLLRFQAQRARTHYLRAQAALPAEARRALMPAQIMGDIYYALLCRIERSGFAVFDDHAKVALPTRRKLAVALRSVARSVIPAPICYTGLHAVPCPPAPLLVPAPGPSLHVAGRARPLRCRAAAS